MAAKTKQKTYWNFINSHEEFEKYYNYDNKKLVVLEIYPSWSGPCEMMFPTYRYLGLNVDDFEKRVDIILVKSETLADDPNPTLKHESSQPRFLFILEGKIKDEHTIRGVNIAALKATVEKLIPLAY